MKHIKTIVVAFACFALCGSACTTADSTTPQNAIGESVTEGIQKDKMKITIGNSVFTATLQDNASAAAFKALLPLTVTMSELHANEKYYYFPGTLPTGATPGGSLAAGDIMLYGNNCLVLFYESFTTSYSYTRLGKIDNPNGLKAALGTGSVSVKFEME